MRNNHTDPGLRASVKLGQYHLHGTVTAAPALGLGPWDFAREGPTRSFSRSMSFESWCA